MDVKDIRELMKTFRYKVPVPLTIYYFELWALLLYITASIFLAIKSPYLLIPFWLPLVIKIIYLALKDGNL